MTNPTFRRAALLLLGLGATGPALAAPATPEQAQKLQAALERYTGPATPDRPKPLTVTPDGDSYKVDIDPAGLLAPLSKLGVDVVKTDHYVVTLTPQGDNTWHVVSGNLPPIGFTRNGVTGSVSYTDLKFDGVFDPKLSAFTSATTSAGGVTRSTTGPSGTDTVRYTGQSQNQQTASDAGDGSVNVTGKTDMASLHYSMQSNWTSTEPGSQPQSWSLDATAADHVTNLALQHLPAAALLDLWAFLVAHPSKAEIANNQAQFKDVLKAVLAFDTKGDWTMDSKDLAVTLPLGRFAASHLAEHVALGGKGPDDELVISTVASGLSIPPDLAPVWAASLVPVSTDINLRVGPVHLHDALRTAAQQADFSADKPLSDDAVSEVTQAFANPLAVVVTLEPTTIVTPALALKAKGNVQLGPMGGPVGSADISATGLDKAIAALQPEAAASPEALQALQFLTLAKQMAKTDPDGTSTWAVRAPVGGAITINGQPLGGDPAQPAPKKKKKSAP